ncbi:unnamed protein product [Timema podura]|uniref:Uncharacterized protein n=1 Tax=Timema podura TaxID=61482 RepID=A0ABN7NZ48_TIMPD|nr:unnamed protein product [Timema podura]
MYIDSVIVNEDFDVTFRKVVEALESLSTEHQWVPPKRVERRSVMFGGNSIKDVARKSNNVSEISLEDTFTTLVRMGYRTVAIDHVLEETVFESKKKKKKGEPRDNTDLVPPPRNIANLIKRRKQGERVTEVPVLNDGLCWVVFLRDDGECREVLFWEGKVGRIGLRTVVPRDWFVNVLVPLNSSTLSPLSGAGHHD